MKKGFYRLFTTTFILLSAGTLFTACGKKSTNEGKVLNIACWNEEFKNRFNDFFAAKGLLPAGVKVNWIMEPNENSAYQNMLDERLVMQKELPVDERIDLFLVESDYAIKYVNTPYTLDIRKNVGLSEEDLSSQYEYTKKIMTDDNGVLKGVSWQVCPGGFIYRRSIAQIVFGTDDPDGIQNVLRNWENFDKTAETIKRRGYYMLSGYDDAFRVFYDGIKAPLVQNNVIHIDDSIKQWIRQTKTYTDKGYNNKANLWSAESFNGAGPEGKVFGYFGPAWFIDYCLAPASLQFPKSEKTAGNGTYGDWAVCNGPQAFSWGGTWLCAADGTDNLKLIHDIMYTMTCKKDTMSTIARKTGDFTNNREAMEELASSSYENSFLGGQNHIKLFLKSADKVSKDNVSPYDQGINETLKECFTPYFEGYISEDEAWQFFYTEIEKIYPFLSKE